MERSVWAMAWSTGALDGVAHQLIAHHVQTFGQPSTSAEVADTALWRLRLDWIRIQRTRRARQIQRFSWTPETKGAQTKSCTEYHARTGIQTPICSLFVLGFHCFIVTCITSTRWWSRASQVHVQAENDSLWASPSALPVRVEHLSKCSATRPPAP